MSLQAGLRIVDPQGSEFCLFNKSAAGDASALDRLREKKNE